MKDLRLYATIFKTWTEKLRTKYSNSNPIQQTMKHTYLRSGKIVSIANRRILIFPRWWLQLHPKVYPVRYADRARVKPSILLQIDVALRRRARNYE